MDRTVEDAAWAVAAGSTITYGVFVLRDVPTACFMACALGLVYLARRNARGESTHGTRRADAFWQSVADAMTSEKYAALELERYDCHRPPKRLKLVARTPAVKEALYELRHLLVYNPTLFVTIAALTEVFLRKHFEAMTDKREPDTAWSALQALRRDLINLLHRAVFDTPKLPRLNLLPPGRRDFDEALARAIAGMQRHTFAMMEALYRKRVSAGHIVDGFVHRAPVPANSSAPGDPF